MRLITAGPIGGSDHFGAHRLKLGDTGGIENRMRNLGF
jgi:hypothetical protein